MPTTPYARLLISVNADTPVAGARTVSGGETIAFSFESQVGWPGNPLARIEFYSYPEGWAGPGGAWTEEEVTVEGPNGDSITYSAFVHESNSAPASFTMPSTWGKYLCRLIVNNGVKNGGQHEDMIDTTPGLEIVSSQGLHDLAWREGEQFSAEPWRKWQGDQAANLRTINTALASVGSAAVAATPNTLALRGASGESSFTRVYTGGTVHSTAVLSVARLTTVIGGKTGAGDDHDFLAEDGADGLVYGSRARSALHAFRCKTSTGYLTVDVGATEIMRVSSTGINVTTGLTYAVNGVGHATAATASSLAFRGSSGELSVGYLYSAGSVATAGFIRLSRNFTAIACKTSGGTDHPILAEDNAEGFVWGSSTLTASWTTHVKTGGAWVLKVNNVTKATLDANGINLATGLLYQINSVIVASLQGGDPMFGNTSNANTYVNVASGGTIRFAVNTVEHAAVDANGLSVAAGKAFICGAETALSAPGGNLTLGSDSLSNNLDIRGSSTSTIRVLVNGVTLFAADSTGLGFFGADPVATPNITGSRGGNAALASLLSALATLGLISDSTTA